MKHIIAFHLMTAAVATIMCIIIGASINGAHNAQYVSHIPDFTRYIDMIGAPLSGQSWCDYSNVSDGLMFCVVDMNDGDVLLTYDVRAGKIATTSKFMETPITIGELIVAWGTPTGTNVEHGRRLVYWGATRAAFILGDFSPTSKVSFVTFWSSAGDRTYEPWTGFSNRRH